MGGDGGTLNNTRAEHARIRHSAYGSRRPSSRRNPVRSSISQCYLSNEPLNSREVVMDKLGQLYNKSALIEALLNRNSNTKNIQHIKKLARDIITVKYEVDEASGLAMCAVTKSVVRCDGTFSVGWFCGCITANITVGGDQIDAENAKQCAACGTEGYRIVLAQTAEKRTRLQKEILDNRKAIKKRKRVARVEAIEGKKKAKVADGEEIEAKEEAKESGKKTEQKSHDSALRNKNVAEVKDGKVLK